MATIHLNNNKKGTKATKDVIKKQKLIRQSLTID